jgi:CubicO group peptidase (beta-lactamase class C family)
MKTKSSCFFTLITLLLLLGLNTKVHASIADSTFRSDTKIETWLKQNNIPILGLGIIKNGKVEKLKVYGNLVNGKPAPLNTVFNIASITKTITSMVALKLVSDGKLDLDEPLYRYWIDPDLSADDRYKLLTTRIILTHQTGFANWRRLNKSKKLEFGFTPGTKYQYSGEGFEYLAKALEKKFNKPFDVLAKEVILNPLRMHDTHFTWSNSFANRFAVGFDDKGIGYPITQNKIPSAADLLKTTVEDYSKFVIALLNGKILKPAVYEDMIKRHVTLKEDKYVGLGWEIFDNLGDSEYVLSHGGGDPGVRTAVFISPKTKGGLIIFTNSDDGYKIYAPLLSAYFDNVGKRIFDIEATPK